MAILAAPGGLRPGVQQALVDQCELLLDRFAVLDPVAGTAGGPATLDEIPTSEQLDTKYAALYYPGCSSPTRPDRRQPPIAPSGHLTGSTPAIDNTRGVHKAPANEMISGITGFETVIIEGPARDPEPDQHQRAAGPAHPAARPAVYGARCLTSDPMWNYINVRRLFIFLEESLDEGTQPTSSSRTTSDSGRPVDDSVTIFLTRVWRDGALMGSKPEDAFFVRCDRSTIATTTSSTAAW